MYRCELVLAQAGNPPRSLHTLNPPEFVKYNADYKVYRGDEKNPITKIHFEFTAELNRKHNPHHPQPRTPVKLES